MIKKINIISTLAALATLTLTPPAVGADIFDELDGKSNRGKCDIHIHDFTNYGQQTYDSLTRYDYLEPLDIRLTHRGRGRCVGILNFERGTSNGILSGAGGGQLSFLLLDSYSTSSVLFDPQTGQTNGLSVSLKSGESVRLKPYFYIQRRQSGQSGEYSAPIDMLFSGRRPSETRRQALTLKTKVKASVQANFTGVRRLPGKSGASLLNFGYMKPGQTERLGLQLRSNSDVDVTLSSRYNGAMKNLNYEGEFLNYDIIVSGNKINLSSQDTLTLGTSVSRNGLTMPIEVTLDNFDKAAAGYYFDVIELRVSAR